MAFTFGTTAYVITTILTVDYNEIICIAAQGVGYLFAKISKQYPLFVAIVTSVVCLIEKTTAKTI